MSERIIKQVICMRSDLDMGKGKIAAQAGHASIMFLEHKITSQGCTLKLSDEQYSWLKGIMTKICVKVSSEEQLLEIKTKAIKAGLEVHLITDAGKTEFGGVPTKTCLAIGPDWSDKIDGVTKHLKLY